MENIFKKGLILGSILSAAAVIGMIVTRQGQELSEEVKEHIDPLTKKLKTKLGRVSDVTRDTFYEMVDTMVDQYAKTKDLSEDTVDDLKKALQNTWHEMQDLYINDGDHDEQDDKE